MDVAASVVAWHRAERAWLFRNATVALRSPHCNSRISVAALRLSHGEQTREMA
jgi:hypothetical protein